ncbi:MAG: ABC transporter substrate-binding protein [Clostridia bacterium]|nr:ABC transporter substrate-binding protein [Clostridia bacterium]
MKKLIALLCVLALAFGLAACSSNSKASEETAAEPSGEETAEVVGTVNTKDVITVGFVQLVDMADAQQMHDSFLKTIDDAGLSDKIVVDFQSASGDTGTMSTIIQGFVDNQYDVVVPMLTPPTQAAVSICGGETPIIFMSVVDPVYSKIMPDLDTVDPAILATGTSNTIPADLIITTANDITPIEEGKQIVIMYNTSQNNSECTMNAAKSFCEENGFPYEVIGYADVTDAITQAQSLDPATTAYVYVTLDSIIASNFNQLGQILADAGIPVYGAADAMTTGGAFCSYGVDYGTVGEMTAQMVIEWYNGTPLESMPCQQYSDFTLVINEGVMNQLGVTLPESYAAEATYVSTNAA